MRKFEVQNQRSKDGEIARLNDTIKSQNKRIIQLEETVDRLQQVMQLTFSSVLGIIDYNL